MVDRGEDPTQYIEDVKIHSMEVFGEVIDITPIVIGYEKLPRPKYDEIEKRFYCGGEFPFCGTIDRLKERIPYENKFTSSPKKEDWRLQLSFYAKAEGVGVIGDVNHVTKEGKGNIISGLAPRFADVDAILRVFYMVHHKQWLKEAKEKMQ